jgi:hypothetical protein
MHNAANGSNGVVYGFSVHICGTVLLMYDFKVDSVALVTRHCHHNELKPKLKDTMLESNLT